MFNIGTEVILRVQNRDGISLDVVPGDIPNIVVVKNTDQISEDYYGPINFGMEPELARHLGRALLNCADEVEGYNK